MKLSSLQYEMIRRWIYQNARPIDLARWKYHFEDGSRKEVINSLAMYQNNDGGFGHALEADCWNGYSSPIQTSTAIEILYQIGVTDKKNPMVRGILDYLESAERLNDGTWPALIPSNNDFPHAPWWTYDKKALTKWAYNPTAHLAGFILFFAEKQSEIYKIGEQIAKQAVSYYMQEGTTTTMHELPCFIRLLDYCKEGGINHLFDLEALEQKIGNFMENIIVKDDHRWEGNYVARPSDFINSPSSPFYHAYAEEIEKEITFIINTLGKDGSWQITWAWQHYDKEFTIAENWWKASIIIKNLRLLNNFNRL